jgi:cytochrome c553
MAKISFGKQAGRVRVRQIQGKIPAMKPLEEVVRAIKKENLRLTGEDYRERSLAIHGLVCARCGRTFDTSNRYLLTVHHRDGNHLNNPPDGSNWENLCVYCHEDTHSRTVLGDYFNGTGGKQESEVVYKDESIHEDTLTGNLGEKLRRALEKKKK